MLTEKTTTTRISVVIIIMLRNFIIIKLTLIAITYIYIHIITVDTYFETKTKQGCGKFQIDRVSKCQSQND